MRDFTKTAAKINTKVGRAIQEHNLIENGDRILVAVSGGKDSLTLLTFLKKIQTWAPVRFDIIAAHIATDFRCGGCAHEDSLSKFFESLDMQYVFRDIKVLDGEGRTTCFWCSWQRRKALFEIANKYACNKVALGHHKDDIAETLIMNLLYNGEISAINARQELFNGSVTIIRPLYYVEEDQIISFAEESHFPKQLCKCPFGMDSKRKYVKELIRRTEELNPRVNIKTNILKSVTRIRREYLGHPAQGTPVKK